MSFRLQLAQAVGMEVEFGNAQAEVSLYSRNNMTEHKANKIKAELM